MLKFSTFGRDWVFQVGCEGDLHEFICGECLLCREYKHIYINIYIYLANVGSMNTKPFSFQATAICTQRKESTHTLTDTVYMIMHEQRVNNK